MRYLNSIKEGEPYGSPFDLRLFNALSYMLIRPKSKQNQMEQPNIQNMHYVKSASRVKLYMHDVPEEKRFVVLNFLNLRKVDYRYIKHQTCISTELKNLPAIKYVEQYLLKK